MKLLELAVLISVIAMTSKTVQAFNTTCFASDRAADEAKCREFVTPVIGESIHFTPVLISSYAKTICSSVNKPKFHQYFACLNNISRNCTPEYWRKVIQSQSRVSDLLDYSCRNFQDYDVECAKLQMKNPNAKTCVEDGLAELVTLNRSTAEGYIQYICKYVQILKKCVNAHWKCSAKPRTLEIFGRYTELSYNTEQCGVANIAKPSFLLLGLVLIWMTIFKNELHVF